MNFKSPYWYIFVTAICPEAEELAQVQERSLPLLQEVKGEEEQVGKFEGLVAGD